MQWVCLKVSNPYTWAGWDSSCISAQPASVQAYCSVLCFVCRPERVPSPVLSMRLHGSSSKRQTREFSLSPGAEKQCSLCAFLSLFFFLLFLLMRCTKEGGKANLIIKPYLPPFSVFPDWEVQSSPLWCKNEIQQHALLNYYLFKMKGNYFQFSASFKPSENSKGRK